MTRIRNGETRKENSESLESRRPAYWNMGEIRKDNLVPAEGKHRKCESCVMSSFNASISRALWFKQA